MNDLTNELTGQAAIDVPIQVAIQTDRGDRRSGPPESHPELIEGDRRSDSLERLTFSKAVQDRIEKYTNKAEKTAFLVGLSLGARQMNSSERQRVCSDVASLYEIDLSGPTAKKTVKKPRKVNPVKTDSDDQNDQEFTDLLAMFG